MTCIKSSIVSDAAMSVKVIWEKLIAKLPTMYGILIVCIYIAWSLMKYVKLHAQNEPEYCHTLEYLDTILYAVGSMYLVYVLVTAELKICNSTNKKETIKTMKIDGDYGFSVRIGSSIFGIGASVYFLLEIADINDNLNSPGKQQKTLMYAKFPNHTQLCNIDYGDFDKALIDNRQVCYVFGFLFIILQTYLITKFPRLKLLGHELINRYGMIHVMTTNVIL